MSLLLVRLLQVYFFYEDIQFMAFILLTKERYQLIDMSSPMEF